MGIKTWSLGLGKGLAWLWIFPAVGALLLSLAAGAWVLGQRFEARALKAEGVVTALRLSASRDSNGRTSNTYCPVVNYQTADGQGIEFAGSTCARPPSYEVGERVRVLYEADAPYQASLDGFAERWLMTLILGSIGTVFALIGAAFVVPNLRRGRRAGELYQTAGAGARRGGRQESQPHGQRGQPLADPRAVAGSRYAQGARLQERKPVVRPDALPD